MQPAAPDPTGFRTGPISENASRGRPPDLKGRPGHADPAGRQRDALATTVTLLIMDGRTAGGGRTTEATAGVSRETTRQRRRGQPARVGEVAGTRSLFQYPAIRLAVPGRPLQSGTNKLGGLGVEHCDAHPDRRPIHPSRRSAGSSTWSAGRPTRLPSRAGPSYRTVPQGFLPWGDGNWAGNRTRRRG
jgi:hypothetical protein